MRLLFLTAMMCLLLLFAGCAAKTGNSQLENATQDSVSQVIIKGQSTKADLRKNFGDPQKVDFTESGLEKWEYSFVRKAPKAISYVPIASAFVAGTNDTTKTLLVIFKGDVVENYALSAAKSETKAGLFQ